MSLSNPASTPQHSYTAKDLQVWLASFLAEVLGLQPVEIDIQAPFDSYGLDSAQIMIVAHKVGNLLGFQLSPLLVWHYPTIESLSQRLAEELGVETELFQI
ncbi:acyl carrier protein [Iningainema tapete]|uniref:Acyl carrier protein n=1 Tax=Iningainema tapete BLCC-T55 TaxID=2748662 RepID=A0A8J6XE55_9CYAN|nr:acyl carrier protein [Iningainema tapete]MBD2770847.1 acyl carrier protein [Iningainema tapete BLCC-T55]